jgi:hypothetical protein
MLAGASFVVSSAALTSAPERFICSHDAGIQDPSLAHPDNDGYVCTPWPEVTRTYRESEVNAGVPPVPPRASAAVPTQRIRRRLPSAAPLPSVARSTRRTVAPAMCDTRGRV